MRQAAQPEAEQGQKAAAGQIRSRPARQQSMAHNGPLTQLAAAVNATPRVGGLAVLNGDIQQSPSVQGLMDLAAEINQSAPFQRQSQADHSKDGLEDPAQLMLEPVPKFAYIDPANENGSTFLPNLWQAPNNVAQKTTDGESPAVSVAKDSLGTGVAQMEFTTATLLALAAAAGIAGIAYILATYGPTYAWIWLKIRISGANPNLSVQQLVQLSNNLPAYSYDDIIRFGGLNLTVVQITQLATLAAANNDANDVMALGGIGNRTFAEIIQISAMVGIAAPTAQEILAIAATAFNMVELGQMANLAQINTAAELVQVATIALPAADILGIAAFPQAPTAAQIATLAATGIPLPALTAIAARPAFINVQAILTFLNLPLTQAQNAANKRRLAELDNMPLVNAMDTLRGMRAFALTNQGGRIVFRFNGGTWANAQADCIAVFGVLGPNQIPAGAALAPNGQARELYTINAHGVVVICRSWSSEVHVLATIEIQAGPRYEFKYQ